MSKKETFKLLIQEFQQRELPSVIKRDFDIPDINKVMSITGSRRSGKTYFFYQKIAEVIKRTAKDKAVYLNLSDERLYPLKVTDLQYLLEAYFELYPHNKETIVYLFLDEVQEVEEWERFVRRVYDTEKVRIFITGSSSKLLHKEIHTLLRGRTLHYTMFPLSFKEFMRFKGIVLEKNAEYSQQRYHVKKAFADYLYNGGFPEVAIHNEKQKLLEDYHDLIIYKDLIERYNIRNLALIKNMLKYLLTNISSLWSINAYQKAISKDVPVKNETISEYLSYLEDANVIFTTSLFSYSLKQQQANLRKIYCIDNGLRNVVSFMFSKDEGRLAENLTFIELLRKEKEVYYWKGKGEVDFIVKENDDTFQAINVCYSNEIPERETKALFEFKKKFKKTKKMMILTKDIEKIEGGIIFVPLWKWMINEK